MLLTPVLLTIDYWLHRKDTKKQRPRFYRVMLHNDNFNRREYVVQVLLKIIPGMTVDDAVNVMQARCHIPFITLTALSPNTSNCLSHHSWPGVLRCNALFSGTQQQPQAPAQHQIQSSLQAGSGVDDSFCGGLRARRRRT